MWVYLFLGLLCIVYDAFYFAHSIRRGNPQAAIGSAILAAVLILISVFYYMAFFVFK